MGTIRSCVLFLLLGIAVGLFPAVSQAEPSAPMVPPFAGESPAAVQRCMQQAYLTFRQEEPERARVIELMLVEDWTAKELAEYLGRDPETTQHFVHTSTQRLHDYMRHFCGQGMIRPQ